MGDIFLHMLRSCTAFSNYCCICFCEKSLYKYLSIMPCSHAGCVFYYTIVQIAVLWLCHVSVIFLKTQFPLHLRNFEKSRLVHLVVVLLAVLLPCIPITTGFATGGYLVPIYPVVVCFIKNSDAAYYSFAFVITVISAIGVPMLIIAFSVAIKVIHHPMM